MSVEVEVDDPVAVTASQLQMVVDGASGEEIPHAHAPEHVERALMQMLQNVVSETLRTNSGVTMEGSSALILEAADDGSYPEVTVRALPGPDGATP
ncbi:hypothetical protein AB0L34_12240 [Micromonospora sp. NPDC052213]|uniref:hypothetical protein n=1 Tax=Micromonospora sp. NPDC052213 TaxID=3155812 RepID=UPI00342AF89D